MNISQLSNGFFKQFSLSLLYKALSIICIYLSVPITIKLMGVEAFGIWATILSIVSWIVLFDLGIGNGLRTKVAAAVANNDNNAARRYIATGYGLLAFLSVALMLVICAFILMYPVESLFKDTGIDSSKIKITLLIVASTVCVNFLLSTVNQLFNATMRASLAVLYQFMFNFVSLLGLGILTIGSSGDLIAVSIIYSLSLILTGMFMNLYFFYSMKNNLPTLRDISLESIHAITGVGLQFFIIQLTVLIIFTTDRVMISTLFGASSAAAYDVIFKIVSIFTILMGLVNTNLLSLYNHSYQKGNTPWIKKMLFRQLGVVFSMIILVFLVYKEIHSIVSFWVGDELVIQDEVAYALMIFVIIVMWNSVFSTVLGGIGFVKFGALYTIISGVINLPISYYLADVAGYGVSGIIWGTVISLMLSAIISPIQVYFTVFASKEKYPKLTMVLR